MDAIGGRAGSAMLDVVVLESRIDVRLLIFLTNSSYRALSGNRPPVSTADTERAGIETVPFRLCVGHGLSQHLFAAYRPDYIVSRFLRRYCCAFP